MKKWIFFLPFFLLLGACKQSRPGVPVIGFADAFEDNTIEQAHQGFMDALAKNGFDEKKGTLQVIYRNAQGNIPTLTQIIKYFISEKVKLIAANPSLATITAVQNTKTIPIFMMVSPTPSLMKVLDAKGNPPANLFGVGENLDYIDTSFLLIPRFVNPGSRKITVGMIYNQSEPQSVEAIHRIEQLAADHNINLVSLPVNSTADVQLVTASLLSKNIDAFFANPDNTVFGSFETIVKLCNEHRVPIFTSEAGLVERGAIAAYGADLYQWGYQAGEQAARFLRTDSTRELNWQMVRLRKRVYNKTVAGKFGIKFPPDFQPVP